MKKLVVGLVFVTLCAVPQLAQATGKIRSVDVYDPDGIHTFPNANNALKAGDTVYIRFRLVNLGWAETSSNPAYTNPWQFMYTGPLTGDATLDEQTQNTAPRPRLGLWIGERVREAECANFPLGVASDWLSDRLDDEKHYTDLIFAYTIQAGDLALPIRFANATGTGPITDGGTYYLKNDGQDVPWALKDSKTASATADFAFGPANLYNDPDSAGEDLTKWTWVSSATYENRDLDLSGAGVYVQAIDFDSTYADENTGVWRTVEQESTVSDPGAPAIIIENGAAQAMDLYVWTGNTNIAEIVEGGRVVEVNRYTFGDGVVRTVGRVHVYAGDTRVPFSIKATGVPNEATQVFLSAMPTNIYNVIGDVVPNFITRTLKVEAYSVHAVDYTWSANPVNGNWLVDANWNLGAWNETILTNKAVFGASSQTSVDVNGDVTASSVVVSGADYAFGGTGTLEVNGSFNVAAGNTVTVNGPLAQTGPLANRLVKDGDGTLVVKGDSTLGYFAIHGGTVKFDGGMHAITNVSTGAGESAQGLSLAKGTMVVEGGATVMTTANSMYAANSGVDMYVTNGVFDVWSLKSDYLNAFKDNIGSFAPRRSRLTLKDEGTFVVKAFRISKAMSTSYPDNPDEVYLGPGGRFVFRNFCMDEANGSKFYATMNLDGGTLITTNTPTDKANGAKLNRFSTGDRHTNKCWQNVHLYVKEGGLRSRAARSTTAASRSRASTAPTCTPPTPTTAARP